MKKFFTANDHVLPRPLEPLPEYAHAKSRHALAEKLIPIFKMSDAAAEAISNAVVDPSAVRKSIGEPDDPQVEEIAVPGGVLLGIRTSVWARRIMPDPRNPRIGPSRRHPFAIEPGTGGEDSRFRPVPEPHSPEGKAEIVPELVVDIDSRPHLEWASAQAAKFVLAENDWRDSIKSQGVMEAVWLVATTYQHADGSAPATVMVTVEGSSRTIADHDILGVRSSDLPYEDPETQKLRAHYRQLNEAHERGETSPEQAQQLRCERVPALILVGFRPNSTSTVGFPTAVKSLVALRHVDPPKPWGEGPANESLADEVLDELFRRNLITATERSFFAGSCTKSQAREAHLPDDPASRASRVVALFAQADDPAAEAIRVAVTSQSTRKRISKKMCNELATALIVRSFPEHDPAKRDKVRRYMRHAFGQAVYSEKWQSTGKPAATLVAEAMGEVDRSIGNPDISEPGPASLELAVRAAYPLIVTGRLSADRGSAGNDAPDRRHPGEVLDTMRRKVAGVHQLAQALEDFTEGRHIRAVDENGAIRKRADGDDLVVTDAYLREQFSPPGKTSARSGGSLPTERLKDRLADLSDAFDRLEEAFRAVTAVTGNDGVSLVESDGVEHQFCEPRRELLDKISDDLSFWSRTFRKRHGAQAVASGLDSSDADGTDDSELDQDDADEAYVSADRSGDDVENDDRDDG